MGSGNTDSDSSVVFHHQETEWARTLDEETVQRGCAAFDNRGVDAGDGSHIEFGCHTPDFCTSMSGENCISPDLVKIINCALPSWLFK